MSLMKDVSPKSYYYNNSDMQRVLVSSLKMITSINEKACGKCSPCRIGHIRLEEILRRMTSKNGRENDLEIIINLAKTLNDISSCSLGRKAPNYILTSLDLVSMLD